MSAAELVCAQEHIDSKNARHILVINQDSGDNLQSSLEPCADGRGETTKKLVSLLM